ncbi:MAG: FtsK/SpoIIIE domain-containing protein [Pseudomonadota bacterium]|nr:FtsK/SpoIIIE domain-containing protein [Pseudomonadota bacterium]
MSEDLVATRARIAKGIAQAHTAFAAAHAAEQEALERDLTAAMAPAREAAARAMRATHPGTTTAGAPLWVRAMAGWSDGAWDDRSASAAAVGVGGLVRVGTSESVRLGSGRAHELPALVPMLCASNLVFAGAGPALATARDALVSVVTRVLATVPPGKVRLTIMDAIGLGSSFPELLHLDERLRGPKVWHEESEILGAVQDLTAHMSMVIQRYLRSDHASIDAYNRIAGEVAEPYRLLVVAGFPAGFRPEAAERLLSIAKNGPKLGVQVLLTLDEAAEPPQGFVRAELYRHATVIAAQGGRWSWRHGTRAPLEIALDPRPPREVVEGILAAVNPHADAADDVRVPFATLLADEEWAGSTAEGLRVPLGRRGARDVLELRLGGRGTAHHALVGGRTGSGKTVLLHVLIQSLAARYSPEELELYLVDFKEGVEFQVYRDLPHVRVVAVQSEREFGLSVLEGLRAELNRRGERFRERGLDELPAWRRETGERLARIVLVVDEFQVLFEANDTVANQARAHLSDLVSRGRSFGIHVVLASQTLAAMDLDARTLSQVGVRVALQMSEVDSYKVLGKDNDAARLLSRPGEAVFNDAGGLPGNNVRFQVAWLPREEREARVAALRARAPAPWRPVVFAGNQPATLAHNDAFVRALATPTADRPRVLPLWLGEATSLQEGHAAWPLRRQARGSVLLVGPDEAAAARTVLIAVASVAVQLPRGEGRLLAADLAHGDDAHATLGLLRRLPIPARIGEHAEVESLVDEAHAELMRRRDASVGGARGAGAPWLLVLFGLQRARALERVGMKTPPAGAMLGRLLAEGPDHGVHVLVWCDTATSLQRALAPGEMNEFGCRVALASGEAGRVLGPQVTQSVLRAGYALWVTDEDPERVRKVRIYGEDSVRWLADRFPVED